MTNALIIKQKRKRFKIIKSVSDLEQCLAGLPEDDLVYKFVTNGNFSSISFVKFISDRCHIYNLYASSFRIGKKELRMIDRLYSEGQIDMCHFAVGTLMANDSQTGRRYHYYDNFKDVCTKNKWEYITTNNHSKILLFDTDKGKFVIETSSNLNENPKIEQFSLEKSEELYEFYEMVFKKWAES